MKTIKLCYGIGTEGDSHCVMAATSIVAGEPFTDRPECVCSVITGLLIEINDMCDDSYREELLGHLPWLIIGTRGDWDVVRARLDATLLEFGTTSALAYSNYMRYLPRGQEWKRMLERWVGFIENVLIPIHTTMTVEPGFAMDKLVTEEV